MRKIRFKIFAFVLSAAAVWAACRKVDMQIEKPKSAVNESRFFSGHRSSDPFEKALVDFMKRKNDKEHFVEKTVNQIGYPRWDKAITIAAKSRTQGRGTSDSTIITYIPFARDSQNYVNASMAIRTSSTDTSFTYLCDWQYSQRTYSSSPVDTSAEGFALFFMMMDKKVFGHTDFVLTDTMLFPGHPKESDTTLAKIHLVTTTSTHARSSVQYIEECLEFAYCGSPQYCANHGGCDYLNCISSPTCGIFEICWLNEIGGSGSGSGVPTGGGTGGTTSGGGSGSGGTTGGSTPPPCGGSAIARGMIQQGCVPGWVPTGGGSNPPPIEPIDSMLANYSRKVNRVADSVFALSQSNKEEWGFIIVQNVAGEIYAKACTTSHNDRYVKLDRTLVSGERIIAEFHTHPDPANNPLDRSAPSGSDFNTLKINSRDRYTSFVDCGNVRYAIVIENVNLSRTFFQNGQNAIDLLDFKVDSLAQTKPNWVANWQNATEVAIKELIGSSTASGIGIYKSDATKTNFIKLN